MIYAKTCVNLKLVTEWNARHRIWSHAYEVYEEAKWIQGATGKSIFFICPRWRDLRKRVSLYPMRQKGGRPRRGIRIPRHGAFSQISSSDNGALEHQCRWSLFSSPIKGCGFFWRTQPWSLQPTKFNVVALSNNVSDNKRIIHTASHG